MASGDTKQIKIFHICGVCKEGSVTTGLNNKTEEQHMGILFENKEKTDSKPQCRKNYISCL